MPRNSDSVTEPIEREGSPSNFKAQVLIDEQIRLVDAVKRHWANFKKDGSERRTLRHINGRLSKLEEIHAEFRENNRSLSQLGSNETVKSRYHEVKIEESFMETYIDVFASIENERDKHFPPKTFATSNTEIKAVAPGSEIQKNREVPLPEVKLPTFSGEYTEWSAFKEIFTARIHNSQQLSDQQRLQYLKGHVTGAAADDIKHIAITGDNFAVAWRVLTETYENDKLVFYHYMQIFDNQALVPKDDPAALRSFIQTSRSCLNAMHKLDSTITEENRLLAYYMLKKLPISIRAEFNHENRKSKTIPTFKDLCCVLEEHLQMMITSSSLLNMCHRAPSKTEPQRNNLPSKKEVRSLIVEKKQTAKPACVYCKDDRHYLRRCSPFQQLSAVERRSIAERMKLCLNCLGFNHTLSKCSSRRNCSICGGRHHTLIHSPYANSVSDITSVHTSVHRPTLTERLIPECEVLLPTAAVRVSSSRGEQLTLRAFLDQGSQASFITERAVQRLQLSRARAFVTVNGLAASRTTEIRHYVNVTITSRVDHRRSYSVKAFVLKRITGSLPEKRISPENWPHIHNLQLADPNFFIPNQVDLLIGNNLYDSLILSETRRSSDTLPIAQLTTLGWIVSGKIRNSVPPITMSSLHLSTETQKMLNKIYSSESFSSELSTASDVDSWCEQHFRETHRRLSNGQYLVRLPFKSLHGDRHVIGQSRQRALTRFLSLEKKLQRDETLRHTYGDTIQDYIQLNQMHPVIRSEQHHTKISPLGIEVSCCYLPHHPILKTHSTTTKVRVVYDASSKTDNGRSLNDILAVGPRLQNDLTDILLHWRFFGVVVVADIEKMYRRIKVNYDDAQFQRILWRSSPSDEMQEFFCDVVMFGLAPAPFLAIRTLHQLADDESTNFPLAVDVVKRQMYVDDLLAGSHTIEEMLVIRHQVEEMLRRGGFELRKWASNQPDILESIPSEHRETKDLLILDGNTPLKTLGVFWNPKKDILQYQFNLDSLHLPATKRRVLSITARLFDPAGWLSPVIIIARDLLQKICSLQTKWDEPIPQDHQHQWNLFLRDLQNVSRLQIPRWLRTSKEHKTLELHIFCDASKIAYSACAYIRTMGSACVADCNLLIAKSKVIPLKAELTVPRAELLAAVLAVKLFHKIKQFLPNDMKNPKTYFWSDSTTVLWWINGDPERHKVFVANRIRKILEQSSPSQWLHVRSSENPADCASRGLSALRLVEHTLWWQGPEFLRYRIAEWPSFPTVPQSTTSADLLEIKKIYAHVSTLGERKCHIVSLIDCDRGHIMQAVERSSSFLRIIRIFAYCHRFISNCKFKQTFNRQFKSLKVHEVQRAVLSIVRLAQLEYFSPEFKALAFNGSLPDKSNLWPLNPFFDNEHMIIRLAGRLRDSLLPANEKFPIIVPEKSHITELIIRHSHSITLHGGVQLTLNHIRKQFWIIHGRKATTRVLHQCIVCYKSRPKVASQMMANLPQQRIRPARAFESTGVDYAGPFCITPSKGRGITSMKGYVALFICLSTKAIHLEVVSDLSSEAFLAALKRFIARRGFCNNIFSDCGTNFVGANKLLRADHTAYRTFITKKVIPHLTNLRIQWHFIPPSSPHFGGLWEAGVKSVKTHLRKIINKQVFTYEEFSTIMCQIESCLNSRPLCPLNDDPDNLIALTPGHFLIGDSLLSHPEPEVDKICLTKRWQLCQGIVKHFWRRWSSEYLSRLQNRPKGWRRRMPNVQINQLVLLKDERLPPNQWKLGRIIEVQPGPDGLVRVVTLKTADGDFKRPITKICVLPIETTESESRGTTNLLV